MRTVTHKFACLYLKIKFKDNLKTHETEQLIICHIWFQNLGKNVAFQHINISPNFQVSVTHSAQAVRNEHTASCADVCILKSTELQGSD